MRRLWLQMSGLPVQALLVQGVAWMMTGAAANVRAADVREATGMEGPYSNVDKLQSGSAADMNGIDNVTHVQHHHYLVACSIYEWGLRSAWLTY